MRGRSYLYSLVVVGCFALLSASSMPVSAQIPSSADTSRMKSDQQRPAPETFKSTTQPKIEVSEPARALAMPENAEEIKFELGALQLNSVTVYKQEELSGLWEDKVGKSISLADVYAIASEITNKYRNQGYVLSRAYVPAQTIDKGIVIIEVEEGYISKVKFEGDFPKKNKRLRDTVYKKVRDLRPFDIKALERQMLFLNELPGMSTTSILKAIPEEEGGGIALVIKATKDKRPYKASAKLDNSGSRYIGPFMASADFVIADLFSPTHTTTVSLKAPIDIDELHSISGTHTIPVDYNGLSVVLSAGYVESAPGYTLDANSVKSRTVNAGVELVWDLERQRRKNTTVSAAFELMNSKTDVLGAALSRDHVRSLTFKAHRDWYDSKGGFTTLDGSIGVGLNIPGASDFGDANLSRTNGRPDYLLYEASAYRLQNLPGAWSVLGGIAGQLTNNVLLSPQQFGYGGETFGRAYDSSEITGDRGVSAMVEVRYDKPVPEHNVQFQHFAFYDIGKVWQLDTTSPGKATAASAGVGTRMDLPKSIDASLTVAQPLTRDIGAPQYGASSAPRFLFSVSSDF